MNSKIVSMNYINEEHKMGYGKIINIYSKNREKYFWNILLRNKLYFKKYNEWNEF